MLDKIIKYLAPASRDNIRRLNDARKAAGLPQIGKSIPQWQADFVLRRMNPVTFSASSCSPE